MKGNKRDGFRPPQFGDDFARLVVPLLDCKGNSVWPERFDAAKVTQIRKASGEAKFKTQMLLEAADLEPPRLDGSAIKRYVEEIEYHEACRQPYLSLGGKSLVGVRCWWDPAWGRNLTGKGDGSVVAAVFFDCEGAAYIHRLVWLNEKRPTRESQAVRQCELVAKLVDELLVVEIHVEANGLGTFLPGLLQDILYKRRISTKVTATFSKGDKNTRILQALEARLAAGSLYAHKSVWETRFFEEMENFRPGDTQGRDDSLDAVSQALNHAPEMPRRYRVGADKPLTAPWPMPGPMPGIHRPYIGRRG